MLPLVISVILCLYLLYGGPAELNLYFEQTHSPHLSPLAEKDQLLCFLLSTPCAQTVLGNGCVWGPD